MLGNDAHIFGQEIPVMRHCGVNDKHVRECIQASTILTEGSNRLLVECQVVEICYKTLEQQGV